MRKKKCNPAMQAVFDALEKTEEVLGGIFLLGIVIVVVIQIFGRLVGHSPTWTEESTRFCFLWMMWVALSCGFNHAESSRVVAFARLFPKVIQKIFKVLYVILNIVFFAFIAYYGVFLVQQQIAMHEMGAALRIPMYLIGVSVPISGVFGILAVIRNIMVEPELLDFEREEV